MSDNNQAERQPADQHLQDKPQIFRTLRNIDLNLLTIFEAVYVHKGIVNAAKILNLTPSASPFKNYGLYFPIRCLFAKARA